jgi:flagellar biosynthesis protein FlhF
MRIIRYMAPDTRQALRGVREQLGEDAVILSSKRTADGVEVTAAAEMDVEASGGAAAQATSAPSEWTSSNAASAAAEPAIAIPRAQDSAAAARSDRVAATVASSAEYPATTLSAAEPPKEGLNQEMRIIRRMLESQLEQLAWNDRTRRTPAITEILRELTEIGIAQELAERIGQQLPEQFDLANARRFALHGLSEHVPIGAPRWTEDGGRVAFIGATGVGKTTTLAKIAVRWVLRNGPNDMALVAADSVRIGAQDQLQSLGQLLGAPVYAPDSFAGLGALLNQLTRFRLVLIDTPGISVRDPQLDARLAALTGVSAPLECVLVLPANAQAGALEEAVKRFAPVNPSCCVLTKVDEAASLGGALSTLVSTKLPIAYVSEGQRVPEDLQPARALDLVSAAVRLAKAANATADEDLLRRRFGKVDYERA